jgi:carboxyl-terminal processing protease
MDHNENNNGGIGAYNAHAANKSKLPKTVSLQTVIVLILITALITFQLTFVILNINHTRELDKTKDQVKDFKILLEALDFFDKNYIYDIDEKTLINHMLLAFGGQDKYSTYYTYEEYEELMASSRGEGKGIGIYITGTNTSITITYVIKNSPAERAGLLAGDRILAIDGMYIESVGYFEASKNIAGENGTTVYLTIERNGQIIEIPVVRGEYIPETVVYTEMTEGGEKIGFVKIVQFDYITVTQFKTAMESLMGNGCKKIIFDVRDNPGGVLGSVLEILDYLLPKGPMVHILDKDMNVIQTVTSDKNEVEAEMAVLTNENTASAAELFASAMRDYNKATLIGQKTYGKGCGQDDYVLSNGGVITITTFFYNPPFGKNYNGEGIYPNVEVELPAEYRGIDSLLIPFEKDTQLRAAIESLIK